MKNNYKREILATLILAWPIILSNVSQMLVNATDVFLLGRVGKEAMAASAIGVGLVITPLVFGIGLVQASSPIIAKELGARAHSVREVRRTVRASLWVAAIYSLPVMFVLWFSGQLAQSAGLDKALSENIGLFVRGLLFQILPVLMIVALRNFVVSLHRPIWSMIIGFFNVAFNAFINSGLILGYWGFPKLGLLGAGIGSALTALFSLILFILVIQTDRQFKRYHIFGHFWHFDFERIKELWRLGLPIGLQIGFEVSVFSLAVFLMGYISETAAAAHSIAIQIASLTFMVPMGISQAATVRVGNAYGRNDGAAISTAGWSAFIIGVVFMSVMAIIMYIFPQTFARIFIDSEIENSAAVIATAIGFIKIAAIFQIADGAQVVGAGMLRGLHDTKWPMIFAAIGYWGIGIGAGVYLGFYKKMGGNGIWWGLAIGLGVVAAMMIWRWTKRKCWVK